MSNDDDEARAEIEKKYEKLLAAASGTDSDNTESDNSKEVEKEPEYQKPTTSNIVDMMLGKSSELTQDSETMILETQKRIWRAIKQGGVEY